MFTARRPWVVLGMWLAFIAGVMIMSRVVGSRFADRPTIPGSESQRAADLVQARFPEYAGAQARVVFHARTGTLNDASAAERMSAVLGAIAKEPHVIAVSPPELSPSGRVAVAQASYDAESSKLPGALDRLRAAARDHASGDPKSTVEVAFSGELVSLQTTATTGWAEIGGLVAAIGVLLVVFGSVVATSLPIGMALLSVALGGAIVGALGTRVEISSIAPMLATMLGLGVGIDYALFLLTRFRQELAAGHDVPDAVARTVDTAGRAVLFAGLTVIVSILGLAFAGVPFVGWMGVAVAIVVMVAVAAAVTLLPSMLALLGRRVDWLRIPGVRLASDDGSVWKRWCDRVARRPMVALVVGLVVLVALASPVTRMNLGVLDDSMSPPESTQHIAYTWIASGFGSGANGPLEVVIAPAQGKPLDDAVVRATDVITRDPEVLVVLPPLVNATRSLALLTVIPVSAPENPSTTALVHRLRDRVLPAVTRDTGASIAVGGLTPLTIDLDEAVGAHLPTVVGSVLLASFALLLVVFRSVLVPLKAVLLNLLSIGAAYGVVVIVFQYGVGVSLLGLDRSMPIVSFLPLLMFAVLFGLSMDYEVFMLTRVREEHAHGASATESVSRGIAKTARVVSSAAIIMVSVFVSFALGHDPVLKMFGVGLATAVALDATVVRLLLVPATMVMLGEANWWLPAWLAKLLPELDVEGGDSA